MRHIAWLAAGLARRCRGRRRSRRTVSRRAGSPRHPICRPPGRNNAVARLNRRLEEGKVRLRFDGPQGYLRSVLQALEIPVESQVAVFSKTSLQARIISPANPRTIFFNESVSAAWVRGEPFVELAAEDRARA